MNYDLWLERPFQQRCLETDAFEAFLEAYEAELIERYIQVNRQSFEEWAFEEFQKSQKEW